jgi:hypothetical protein
VVRLLSGSAAEKGGAVGDEATSETGLDRGEEGEEAGEGVRGEEGPRHGQGGVAEEDEEDDMEDMEQVGGDHDEDAQEHKANLADDPESRQSTTDSIQHEPAQETSPENEQDQQAQHSLTVAGPDETKAATKSGPAVIGDDNEAEDKALDDVPIPTETTPAADTQIQPDPSDIALPASSPATGVSGNVTAPLDVDAEVEDDDDDEDMEEVA